MSGLAPFEGIPVKTSALRLIKAGDGLSEALELDPIELHHGDRVSMVVDGYVVQVNHKPDGKVEDGEIDYLVRVHTVQADDIALVDPGDISTFLDRNRERVAALKAQRESDEERQRRAEAGELEMFEDGDADALHRQHEAGVHADGLRDGCPDCEEEREAAEAGD